MPRKKKIDVAPVDEAIKILDPQVELRKIFEWSRVISNTLLQMNEDMIMLGNSKIAAVAELEVLGKQIADYNTELQQIKRDVSRLKCEKLVVNSIHPA